MEYQQKLVDDDQWIENAKSIKMAADINYEYLIRHKNIDRAELKDEEAYQEKLLALSLSSCLLYGFALENLIKGYSIFLYKKVNKEIVEDIKKLEDLKIKVFGVKDGHNLYSIASKCDQSNRIKIINSDTENLLKKFTEIIKWSARYHVATKKEQNDNHNLNFGSADIRLINSIFNKIKDDIENGN